MRVGPKNGKRRTAAHTGIIRVLFRATGYKLGDHEGPEDGSSFVFLHFRLLYYSSLSFSRMQFASGKLGGLKEVLSNGVCLNFSYSLFFLVLFRHFKTWRCNSRFATWCSWLIHRYPHNLGKRCACISNYTETGKKIQKHFPCLGFGYKKRLSG